jgi:hypothetical protein
MSNKEDTIELPVVCSMFYLSVQQTTTVIILGNGAMKLSSGILFLIVVSHDLH